MFVIIKLLINFVNMKDLKIDHTKLITQSEYAKMLGLTRARINQMVKNGDLKTIKIKGAILIYLG